MKFLPIGKRVIVRRHAAADKTAGGIVIPENAKDVVCRGVIVAVPAPRFDTNATSPIAGAVYGLAEALEHSLPGGMTPLQFGDIALEALRTQAPLAPVAVGDEVCFGKYAGNEITAEGEPYTVLHFDDILCAAKAEARPS